MKSKATTSSIELLNKVQGVMIDFANKNGIILLDHFKTVDDWKAFVIAFTFKQLVDLGVETDQAFDMVCGEGAYNELTTRIWEAGQPKLAAVAS